MTIQVRLLENEAEWAASFSIMRQLRPHLTETEYLRLVTHQRRCDAYRLLGAFDATVLRAVAGFRIATSLVNGKHVYVDDLVSDESSRSKGYGKALLDWMATFGSSQGCGALVLDSGVQRHAAHRFYLRERMDIVAYHFVKTLEARGAGEPQ